MAAGCRAENLTMEKVIHKTLKGPGHIVPPESSVFIRITENLVIGIPMVESLGMFGIEQSRDFSLNRLRAALGYHEKGKQSQILKLGRQAAS